MGVNGMNFRRLRNDHIRWIVYRDCGRGDDDRGVRGIFGVCDVQCGGKSFTPTIVKIGRDIAIDEERKIYEKFVKSMEGKK